MTSESPSTQHSAPSTSSDGMLSHLRVAVVATLVLAVVVSGIYPLVVWGLAQVLFPHKANGSLVVDKDGQVVGSELLGQSFSDPKYFHPRASAASYDPTASAGSNLGPTSAKLINGTTKPSTQPTTEPSAVVDNDGIQLRILHYCDDNGLAFEGWTNGKKTDLASFKTKDGWDDVRLILALNDADHPLTIKALVPIPADAVTASASGLDPHIGVENAMLQAGRIAKVRGDVSVDQIKAMIGKYTEGPDLGILGDPAVNVLKLNLALTQLATNH